MTRVLVVDDDEDTSALLEVLLGRQGFHVILAADLDEARRTLVSGDVSALVTDISLPGGSGLSLLDEGRPRSLRAAIVITGNRSEADRDESTRRGFDACLSKPFDGREIVGLVTRLLAQELQGGADEPP